VPFYEYQCNICATEKLVFHLMTETLEDNKCSSCPKGLMLRVFSKLDQVPTVTETAKDRVEKFLKESKRDLSSEKESLKKREKEEVKE